jgi:hypothetical protein
MYLGMFHPLLQHMTAHTIRRVHKSTVWYLHSHDVRYNLCVWTQEYNKAHNFKSEDEARTFMRVHLGARRDECDLFTQDSLWMGL